MATAQKPLPLPPAEVSRQPAFTVRPARVESPEALDLLLVELRRLDALESHVAARIDQQLAELKRDAALELTVSLGDESMTIADRRAELEAAAEKFCDKNRDELLEDGKQSRAFNHGTIGWRKQKACLEALDDFPAGGNPKLLDNLLPTLRNSLSRIADFFNMAAARFVDLKLSWRKTELLKAVNDGELTAAELKKAGFLHIEPGEKFFIDLDQGQLASQSAEKPR